MVSKADIKTPPALKEDISLKNWEKMNIMQRFISLAKNKQDLPIFLFLGGQALKAVLGLDIDSINDDDGVGIVLERLDKLHLWGKLQFSYQAYDKVRKFKWSYELPIADFIVEFEHLYNKAKAYKMHLPDGILA